MSLDTCRVPGAEKEARIPEGMAELGLGIHGEAGVEQIRFESARSAVDAMCQKLSATMTGERYVALVNNLGGTSMLEMGVLAHEIANSSIGGKLAAMVGPAAMMTSLDMRGFSISVVSASEENLRLLGAPTDIAAWPGLGGVQEIAVAPLPDGLKPIKPLPSEHAPTRAILTDCCNVFLEVEAKLNALDAKTGDGDTGSTLAGAARALLERMDQLPLSDHTQLLRALGQELSQTMGGSSGVLLAIFFAAAGDAASSGETIAAALHAGLARMQEVGGANRGDRTMIDALAPALEALPEGLAAAARAARAGAEETAAMSQALAGRSSYINAQQLQGNVDPGAEAVAVLFERLSQRES
jgi:dihydroxyacetone kinase